MIPVSQRKIQLETRLRDLVARLATIDAELDSHQSKDWEDLATEREADEVLEGMGISGQQEIRQIEAALGRIASGDYGVCATCGKGFARADKLFQHELVHVPKSDRPVEWVPIRVSGFQILSLLQESLFYPI